MHTDRALEMLGQLTSEPLSILPSKADEIRSALFRIADGTITEPELAEILEGGQRRVQSLRAQVRDWNGNGSGVVIVPLFGVVTQRGYFGASIERFMDHMESAAEDDGIGAIIILGDTPGGSVSGVFEASERIYELRDKKRIVTVSDPLLASAGYALGSAAHEVVVSPGSRTGSIGVISIHTEFSRMLEDAGVSVKVFSAGQHKADGNPFEPLSEEAAAHIAQTCDDYYALFVECVSRNMDVDPEDVREGMGQARALTAERAVAEGLAHRVATLDEVVGELAGGTPRRRPMRQAARDPLTVAPVAVEASAELQGAREHDADAMEQTARAPDGLKRTMDAPDDDDTPPAAADAGEATSSTADTAPDGEESTMPEEKNGNGPQDGAGTATATAVSAETDRAAAIYELCDAHGDALPELRQKAGEWVREGKTAGWVGQEIARMTRETRADTQTPAAQPAEEREEVSAAAPPVIRRRFSSREDEPGFQFGMALLGLAAVKNIERERGAQNAPTPAAWLQEQGWTEVAAAMRSDRADQGGAWVPESYLAGEFIELLRPQSAIRQLMPRYVPLEGGNASLPKLTGGATAYYKAEGSRGTKSEGTSGRVNLVGKDLMAFVPMTYNLLRRATPDAAATMRDDAVAAVAQRSDLAFIRGDGTQNTPKGLRSLAAAANLLDANGTVSLANVTTDLGKLVLALEEADVRMIRPGWIFAPRTKHYLMTVRDGNGNYAFRDELLAGMLWGFPYAVTSQIPTNLDASGTAGNDESEVYLSDFADVVVGEEDIVRIDVFDEVTYWDGSAWQSAAQNDEIVLRVITTHDIGLRHDESVAVLEEVTWGA